MRQGRLIVALAAGLGLGHAPGIAQTPDQTPAKAVKPAKGTIKPGGPPAVEVECTLLDGGKLQISLLYYAENSSKLEKLTCNGSLPQIEKQVRDKQLPNRVQEMVDVAFKRLRPALQR